MNQKNENYWTAENVDSVKASSINNQVKFEH